MHLNNYHGVAEFTVLGNTINYQLKEKKSGHTIIAAYESLEDVKNVHRDDRNLIIPGQNLTLYCKWERGRWNVYSLRPGQGLSPDILTETQELECKSQGIWSLEEDVCAFANSRGGQILWGIDDNGEVVDGVKKLLEKYGGEDKLTCHLRNRLKQNTNTLLFMDVQFDFLWKKGLPVLRITVPRSDKVVLYKDALFVRSSNTSQRLTGDRMLSFIYSKYNNQ